MKNFFSFFSIILLLASCVSEDKTPAIQPQLSFKDGHFKIIQFTDMHLQPYLPSTDSTFATIRTVVNAENPDLAVLTGDVVYHRPAVDGWKRVCELFEELSLPFTVSMGNHDAEFLSKDSIYDILMASPMYVGDKGPGDIAGCGNVAIAISGSDGRSAAVVYNIDSNNYPPEIKLGHYDWIHNDQINWYRATAGKFKQENDGKPVPAMAFFHIPLREYAEVLSDPKTIGNRYEGAGAPADFNSGMFLSMKEMGDVMGVFVGHDHDNDYVGLLHDIALGFGRCTGTEAYGDLCRGARVFDLYEGENRFDTWVVTPCGREAKWYYPSGINEIQENEMIYHPAVEHNDTVHGVDYIYYEGEILQTADINESMEKSRGVLPNFDITSAPSEDHFAYRFKTLINIPERGIYRFYTYSDDGSVVYIDGEEVVNNDGSHNTQRSDGAIALEAGFHTLEVVYFEDYMGQDFEIGFSSKNIPEIVIPDELLYRSNAR